MRIYFPLEAGITYFLWYFILAHVIIISNQDPPKVAESRQPFFRGHTRSWATKANTTYPGPGHNPLLGKITTIRQIR